MREPHTSAATATAAFTALARLAKPGQALIIHTHHEPYEHQGALHALFSEGLIIESAAGIEWLPASQIQAWRMPHSTTINPPTLEQSNAIDPGDAPIAQTTPPTTLDTTQRKELNLLPPTGPSISDLELLFAGEPVVPTVLPIFDFPNLDRNIQDAINRWRQKYDYAQKVKEPARLANEVSHIADLAGSLTNAQLYCLAGDVALYSGLGPDRAVRYYKTAASLGLMSAHIALAHISLRELQWTNAAAHLVNALLTLGEGADDPSTVRLLGQCLLRMKDRSISGLGDYITQSNEGPARLLATKLCALILSNDPPSVALLMDGQYESLRTTELGSKLFLPKRNENQVLAAPARSEHRKQGIRQGRVSAFRTDMSFGFLVDNATGGTWYFHASAVDDHELRASLMQGNVRQYVTFEGSPDALFGRYPAATIVRSTVLISAPTTERPERAPLALRLAGVPKDGTAYSRAKKAEQLDHLEEAETSFREEISRNGIHLKSAIKDLSSLLNRRGHPEQAIQLLDQHRTRFAHDELVSLEQLTTNFLLKARRFDEAAERVSRMARQESRPLQKLALQRQQAYCLFAADKLDSALMLLDNLVHRHPYDNATLLLAEKVRRAKLSGNLASDTTITGDEEGDETLESLAMGLSALARRQLDLCDLRGLDARTKESREFSSKDYQSLEKILENLRGRRPRERSDYLLTLAALCELSPEAAGERSLHRLLGRHFTALVEAFWVENAPDDVVRCIAIESLALSPVRLPNQRDVLPQIEVAWVLMLGTYLSSDVERSSLLKPQQGQRLNTTLKLMSTHPSDWARFANDAPYYRLRVAHAFAHLEQVLRTVPGLTPLSDDAASELARLRDDENAFATLALGNLSADRLRTAREAIAQRVLHCRFALDRERLKEYVKLIGDAADYALERHFREKETRYLRLETESSHLLESMGKHPTHLAVERLVPTIRALRDLLKLDFERAESTKPALELRNVLDNDFYSINDGTVALRLQVLSRNESSAPIEAIDLLADGAEPCHSPEPLHAGQSREFELYVRPTDSQTRDGAFTVAVTIQYRTRWGAIEQVLPQTLAVRIGGPAFTVIPNEYRRYSGGLLVEDERMFFGRADLIERIRYHLCDGEVGQCFVIYGQKRSGKSSLLNRVRQLVSSDVVFASVSAGTWSTTHLWSSFARDLVQEIEYWMEDRSIPLDAGWPNRAYIDDQPIASIRDLMRLLRKQHYRVVIAIDEFTYVYEAAPHEPESFMRGWKALLEASAFSALLIGQDTMPRFKQAYPNEFGVTHDERISYLSEEETARMASEPILLEGASRFRGQALRKLYELTAGSPFFLQIACDQLVQHLNARHASFVTEADIDQVTRNLCNGPYALPADKFDSLVTAAGEKVATIPKATLWEVVARVASESLHSGSCHRAALAELPRSADAVKDLIDREILDAEGERVRLRVGLFSTWLRANQ